MRMVLTILARLIQITVSFLNITLFIAVVRYGYEISQFLRLYRIDIQLTNDQRIILFDRLLIIGAVFFLQWLLWMSIAQTLLPYVPG